MHKGRRRFGQLRKARTISQEIAGLANDICPKSGDRIEWLSASIGRSILKHGESSEGMGYFELRTVKLLDPETGTFPARIFVFSEEGEVIGAISNQIPAYEEGGIEEVAASARFQRDHGLFKPNTLDIHEVKHILVQGILDLSAK